VDLRVIDASIQEDTAAVSVLRTDIVVGGAGGSHPPEEETLRFQRRGGSWAIAP
jgi:hypothetical protein